VVWWLLLVVAGCAPGDARSVGALAGDCAGCHAEQAAALAGSGMGRAAGSAVFAALREEARTALGEGAATGCDACHAPAAGDGDGVGCVPCHAAIGDQGPHDGLVVLDLAGPVRGPTGVAHGAPHDTVQGHYLATSQLCGTCHDVNGPGGFVEAPFAHWQAGPADAGCADCHMGPVPGEPGAPEAGADHAFAGPDDAPEVATALLARAVSIDAATDGADLVVTVTNRSPGHRLPDGASFLRELRVRVDRDGDEVGSAWLSTRLTRDGVEVASPILADAQVDASIEPLGQLTLRFVGLAGARACVVFRRYRPDLLAHLGLDPALAGPEQVVACAG